MKIYIARCMFRANRQEQQQHKNTHHFHTWRFRSRKEKKLERKKETYIKLLIRIDTKD